MINLSQGFPLTIQSFMKVFTIQRVSISLTKIQENSIRKCSKKSAAPSFIIPEDIVEGGGGGVDDRRDVNASLAEAM